MESGTQVLSGEEKVKITSEFDISTILKEAWEITKIKGVKFEITIIVLMCIVCMFLLSFLPDKLYTLLCNIFSNFIIILISYKTLKIVKGEKVDYFGLFNNLNNLPMIVTSAIIIGGVDFIVAYLQSLLPHVQIPSFSFLCEVFIYIIISTISIFPMFTGLIVADKGYQSFSDVLEAVKSSIIHCKKHFLTYVMIEIILGLMILISIPPLLIPLFWVFPFTINTISVLYVKEKF